jgi:sporulation protein YlmC with PRC-barrel domain
MIAAELRGGSKPSLNEVLGWIGSRVDDIYGASVGRMEDVWIDPGTGAPRWLLVREGRFGARSTLIPFEDATAGTEHVWVPYERDVIREAPEVQPGTPLTQELEAALRAHFSASAPRSAGRTSAPASAAYEGSTATIRFGGRQGEEPFRGHGGGEERSAPRPQPTAIPFGEASRPRMPERPAPPVEAPPPRREQPRGAQPSDSPLEYAPPQPSAPDPYRYRRGEEELAYPAPAEPHASYRREPQERPEPPAYPATEHDPYRYAPPPQPDPRPAPQAQPDPAQVHIEALRDIAAAGGTHFVEIELSGELSIRGELRSVRITPHERRPPER